MGCKKMVSAVLAGCMIVSSLFLKTEVKAANTEKAGNAQDAVVISAADYEPDTEHGDDWAKAVQEMIADAKEVDGPVILDFPEGTYNLYPDQAYHRELYISNTVGADQNYKMKNIGFLLEGMQDVTIEGNGSVFLFHGNMTSFSTIDSTNITFQNYEFDYEDPSVIDITVESVEGNSAVISVPQYYEYEISGTDITWKSSVSPYTGERYWTAKNALRNLANQVYDASTDLTVRSGTPLFNGLSGLEEIEPHRLKFTYNNGISASIRQGLTYQMRNTTRDHAGMFFWKSENISLRDVGVHFLYGFGIVFQHSTDITLDGVVFDTPEGSGRTTAGFADFLQVSGCKGDVLIENCSFSNPHDDPINIHGTFNQVVERIAANKFKVRYMHNETAGFPNFFVGDEVEFMTKGNMIPVEGSVATVTAVEGPTGCDGADVSGTKSLTDIIITLDKDMPGEIMANTHVVENITYTPSVVIRNNFFKRTPTRGILVTTRKPVVIADNTFDGMGMASIYISNDAQGWYESGPVRDVTIERNTFLRPSAGAAAVFIEPTNPTVSTTSTVHENIKIRENKFYMQNGQVLNAKSVKGLTFTNNEIYRYEPVSLSLDTASGLLRQGKSKQLTTNASWKSYSSQLYAFNGCKEVELGGNQYDGGLNLKATVSNMTADTDLTIGEGEGVLLGNDNKTKADSAPTAYEVSDTSVLDVDENGVMTGIAPGTATVKAYIEIGGEKYYSNEVAITVEEAEAPERNAYLAGAEFADGISADAPFDSMRLDYDVFAGDKDKVTLSLTAEESGASIEVFENNKRVADGQGSVSAEISLGTKNTKAYVCVVSSDRKVKKIYEFDISNMSGGVYLSDLDYDAGKSSTGWGDIKKDTSVEGNALRLLGENGEEKTFEKGIGAHASCNIVYNIEGKGYARFFVNVGIDREVVGKNEIGTAKFMIYGDDKLLAETDVLQTDSPMQSLAANVEGVKELRLVADEVDNNSCDHVDFADGKFISKDTYTVRYQLSPAAGIMIMAEAGGEETSNGAIAASKTDEVVLRTDMKEGARYSFLGWFDDKGNKCSDEMVFTVPDLTAEPSYTAKYAALDLPKLQEEVDNALDDSKLGDYTPESVAVYKEALQKAMEVLNSIEATAAEVDAALEGLAEAKAALALKQEQKDDPTPVPKPDPIRKPPATFENGGFSYTVTKFGEKDGTVMIQKFTGKGKTAVIPAVVKSAGRTYKVTAIDKNVFARNKKLTKITIGANVTSIGANSFIKCTKLKEVIFKSTKAPKIKGKAFKGSKIKTVTVPKKMTSKQLRSLQKKLKSAGVSKAAKYKKKK